MINQSNLVTQEQNLSPTVDLGLEGELQSAGTAAIIQETQAAVVLAKRFPRNIDEINLKLMKACQRKSLATIANYSFPRGGKQVSGASVNLARVAAQNYGNIRWGLDIIRDDDDSLYIRGWAWDIENNTKVTADDRFKKLVYRKKSGWIIPDERDLRELINRRGAIAVRNCLLQVMPKDLIEDAQERCRQTIRGEFKDLAGSKKKCIEEFDSIGITVKELQAYVGHDNWNVDDLVQLKEILNSIRDGQAKKEEFFAEKTKSQKTETGLSGKDIKTGDASTHQGYDDSHKKESTETAKTENGDQEKLGF